MIFGPPLDGQIQAISSETPPPCLEAVPRRLSGMAEPEDGRHVQNAAKPVGRLSFLRRHRRPVGAWGTDWLALAVCPQTYGSPNKKHVGVILQRGALILLLCCFPCWALFLNTQHLLLLLQQDPAVSR